MKLGTFISDNRKTILDAWYNAAASVYPSGMRPLAVSKETAFTNPCGQNLYRDLDAFLKGLAAGETVENLSAALRQTIKIRSIQGMAPSIALRFIFDLKQILLNRYREQFPGDHGWAIIGAWSPLLDAVAGATFDVYEMDRNLLCEVRINELKRSVAGLAAQTRFFEEKR